MRKLLLSLCLTLFAATIMAVPAKRGIYRTLRLANGTEVRAQLCGDEHIHFFRADDGTCYVADGNGTYTLADMSKLSANAEKRRAPLAARRGKAFAKRMSKRMGAVKKASAATTPTFPELSDGFYGKKKGLIILAQFPDQPFAGGHTALDEHRNMPMEEAKELGAVALFGEKYGDTVRVVRFGPSCEFCGGIHAKSTGRIGMFKIISESSVAAGIRRIEAKTGKECENLLYNLEDSIRAIRALFNNAKDLKTVIAKYIDEHDTMRKEIERMQAEAVKRTKDTLLQKAVVKNGVTVVSAILPMPAASVKDLVFGIREQVKENLLCVIGSVDANKPMLTVMLSDDMVKDHQLNAGQMVREAAKLIKGGGGGQPHFATAGGKDADGLSAAVDKLVALANI